MADLHGGLAEALVKKLTARSWTVVAAESCTAGLVADFLAGIPGASQILWGSFVCYTVEAKHVMLGIPMANLRRFGAVSRETALAMAQGALKRSGANLAVSVTGIAGPGGDGSLVPVGTVWIGCAQRGGEAEASVYHYAGSRAEVRETAAWEALCILYRKYLS
ncbi:MAG: nicotinamide-nucleotide amidohydrolase family protein [Treponema sp.]|jgi:PncC family amidohydrolase|nr:nicotinamide-nucleotide amidohydrolase family protein [Treponema sp.]